MKTKLLFLLLLSSTFLIIKAEDYKTFISKLDLYLEEAQITTEDRYINTVWILNSKTKKSNGKSVIMQHGLLDGGFTFLILGKDSLAKQLCEEGYTVYLHYSRGTQFSRTHLDYDSSDDNSKYWDFSFDEMAKYDIPALINYVKKRDNVKKVIYIGHSQGTLMYFLAYINDPGFIEKNVEKFVALGTVPNVNNAPHFVLKVIDGLNLINIFLTKNIMTFPIEIGPAVIQPFCITIGKSVCKALLNFFFGGFTDTKRIDYDRLGKNIFLYEPGGTSLQNLKHWLQIYKDKKLHKYDNGKANNLLKYGSEVAPVYDLKQMRKYSIPSLMTISDADPFANPQDTLEFLDNIDNRDSFVQVLRLTNYNHIDYFWADSAITEIFPKVLKFIKN